MSVFRGWTHKHQFTFPDLKVKINVFLLCGLQPWLPHPWRHIALRNSTKSAWQEKTGSSKIKIISLIFNCHFLRSIFVESSLRMPEAEADGQKSLLFVSLQLYRLKQSWSNTEITKTKLTNARYECFCRNWKNWTLFAVKLHLCRKKIPETKSLLVFKTWDSCWLFFTFLDLLGVNRTMCNCGLLRIFKCAV